jgi:large subunit ribosomal protein L22
MESKAHLRHLRMAPRKVAVVADLVRGKPVGAALNILKFTRRAAAKPVAKLIQSAVANATDLSKGQVDVDRLVVETISVDQGPTAKRHMPRAMGRATPIHKKTSHVHVVLSESSGKRK